MHRLLQTLSAVVLVCLSLSPASAADCRHASLAHLRASAPDGYAIYQQTGDKAFFFSWLNCDDAQFDLSTAVHESTHFITGEIDAFPLVDGGTIARPHEVSAFFPPSRIAKQFKADDFSTIYLRLGKASSSTDFLYLLDELNAYSHDLNAAMDLKDLKTADEAVDHRDGLAAMMAFVAVYAEMAQASEPETWNGLREPRVARTVSTLWRQAERVMAASCGIPNFGNADKSYIRQFCTPKARSALEPILGRAPVCPVSCLNRAPDEEAEGGMSSDAPRGSMAKKSTAGPSWIRAVIQSRRTSRDMETDGTSSADETR